MLEALPALIFYLGMPVSYYTFMSRAGLMAFKRDEDIDWREFIIPNIIWFLATLFKAFIWPVILCIWLFQGRPPSPWRAYSRLNDQSVRVIRRIKAEGSGQTHS